jgi:hypothetical protein
LDGSARPAVNANETHIRMIASLLARGGFLFGLLVGHTMIDALKNLLFRESNVFEAADFHTGKRRPPLHAAVKECLDSRIGEADKPQQYRFRADGVELVRASDLQNLRLCEACVLQIRDRFRASEHVLVRMSSADESDAGVIGYASLFELDELGHFLVRSVQRFELLDVVGPHSSPIERAVVGKKVLLASNRQEDARNEKQDPMPPGLAHDFIVAGARRRTGKCAVGDTRRKDRVALERKDAVEGRETQTPYV